MRGEPAPAPNRPWVDPMPEHGERQVAQALRGISEQAADMPEWKKQSFGSHPGLNGSPRNPMGGGSSTNPTPPHSTPILVSGWGSTPPRPGSPIQPWSHPTFGKVTKLSLTQQRESLPIFRLKKVPVRLPAFSDGNDARALRLCRESGILYRFSTQ